jgi:hypothetical protein
MVVTVSGAISALRLFFALKAKFGISGTKKALKHLPEGLFQRDANSTAKFWWVVQGLNL